jgi:hypothetical protein
MWSLVEKCKAKLVENNQKKQPLLDSNSRFQFSFVVNLSQKKIHLTFLNFSKNKQKKLANNI